MPWNVVGRLAIPLGVSLLALIFWSNPEVAQKARIQSRIQASLKIQMADFERLVAAERSQQIPIEIPDWVPKEVFQTLLRFREKLVWTQAEVLKRAITGQPEKLRIGEMLVSELDFHQEFAAYSSFLQSFTGSGESGKKQSK